MERDRELPLTEQSHHLSQNIDTAPPDEISRIMGDVESDIFQGWKGSKGIFDGALLEKIQAVRAIIADVTENTRSGQIILAGCGTSGRFAFFISRKMNARQEALGNRKCFDYLMAGGDEALFSSVEAPEDDPLIGRQMLEEATPAEGRVVYIGITCGLSASFVAGQLDLCMQQLDTYTPVLIGFNPVNKARNSRPDQWTKSFLQVAEEMARVEETGQAFILNPAIGPEAVTGSSRLKGGTATDVILEALFWDFPLGDSPLQNLESLFHQYHCVLRTVHGGDNDSVIGQAIHIAAQCLGGGGHLHYVGDESLGVMGLVDASECPPTFSSPPGRIGGFTRGGYHLLGNKQGDMSHVVEIALDHFQSSILPHLEEGDLVVVLAKNGEIVHFPAASSKYKSIIVNIITDKNQAPISREEEIKHFDLSLNIDLSACLAAAATATPPLVNHVDQTFTEIAVKWCCNALTTGAHVRLGKVYSNYMIDVQVSNNKLFHRAIRIIRACHPCTEAEAMRLLLSVIHQTDDVTPEMHRLPVSEHVAEASGRPQVVPVAIIMGLTSSIMQEATAICAANPIIRESIHKYLTSH